MPKIGKLRKKQNRYEVTFMVNDTEESIFEISEDLVVQFRLLKGKELTDEQFTEFEIEANVDKVYQKLKRYVLIAGRSNKEVDKYLEKYDVSVSEKKTMLAKLDKEGLLDEKKTISEVVALNCESKRIGPKRIDYELSTRGFPIELIQATLLKVPSEQWLENIEYLFFKKLESMKRLSRQAANAKMKQYLYGKGYYLEHVNDFIQTHQADFDRVVNEKKELERELEIIQKRLQREDMNAFDKRNRIITYLLRKGYPYEMISHILEGRK
ncbi:MAG: RecX family transcriptional regulator [Bacilli bacterium]|nr:RecX family transcriptional regulator [Bacilli bacterium]